MMEIKSHAPYWYAHTDHMASYPCDHRHPTREEAEGCLPDPLPEQWSGSLTHMYSRARVCPGNRPAVVSERLLLEDGIEYATHAQIAEYERCYVDCED